VRASDADRERVAATLQSAYAAGQLTTAELEARLSAAYASVTDIQLAEVLRDLRPAPQPGTPSSTRDIGVLNSFNRRGRWSVGRRFRGVALVGNGEIDLREARFVDGETTIQATAIVGNIAVIVPEDAEVHTNGISLLGGFDTRDDGPGAPGAPKITVTGFALLGNVTITRLPAGAALPTSHQKRAQRRLDRSRRRLSG
jgi:hypothetical protein